MAMRLDDEIVELLSLDAAQDSIFKSPRLHEAWTGLANRSVEAVQDMHVGLYHFLESEKCLYLAVILLKPSKADMDEYEQMVILHQASRYTSSFPMPTPPPSQVIGLIYATSADSQSTLNFGVSILPDAQGDGYGARAVRLLMRLAFRELRVHRVQARIINYEDDSADVTQQLFTALGFVREGTARRALLCPVADDVPSDGVNGLWRDVVTYAMLDTDWSVQEVVRPNGGVKSMWDAMFGRHEAESEEHVHIEERTERRRRKARMSPEPIRMTVQNQDPIVQPPPSSSSAPLENTLNTWIWESEAPGRTTPQSIRSASPALSQSSASSSSSINGSYYDRLAAFRANQAAPLSSGRFTQTPWAELFNTPFENRTSTPGSPGESADEMPQDDEDTASTVSSSSTVEHGDMSEGEMVSDVESVVSVPSSASALSDASDSSWFDPFDEREVVDDPDAQPL